MINIHEILKKFELEIPEDKKADFDKEVAANYKTVVEFDKKLGKAETERDNYKAQLDTANETLKSFEGVDLDTINRQLDDYKKKAEDAERDYQAKIADRDFNDALKLEMEQYKFSSDAARRAVMSEIKEKGLKLENGKILGFNDLMSTIKERDGSAFIDEDNPPARFTQRMNTNKTIKKYSSKDEIMKIKDSAERQTAIAENYDLFTQKG